jgi:hypothetical protein
MPESTIRVLRDDCSYAENLVGDLGGEFVLKEKLHFFFVDGSLLRRRKVIHAGRRLSQKFSFRASFFKWRQNLLLYHMYHFWNRRWEQSRPEPYLFFHSRDQLFCRAEWPAETEVFEGSIESFSNDLSMAEDEVEDVVVSRILIVE